MDLDERIKELSRKVSYYNKDYSELDERCFDPEYLIKYFIKNARLEYKKEGEKKRKIEGEKKEFKLGLAEHNELEPERIKSSFDLIERVINLSEYRLRYMKNGRRKILNYSECIIEITERSSKCSQERIRELHGYITSPESHYDPDFSMAKVLNNLRSLE